MRKILTGLVVLALLAFSTNVLVAGLCAPKSEAAKSESSLSVAVFKVPGLSEDLAGKIAGALAGPGITSAKPDLKNGKLSVVFQADKTCPGRIGRIIKGLAADASLENVTAADKTSGGSCGMCPLSSSCAKKRGK
ncbi:MAG: hypothetical protein V1736_13945 [Pseudomonadota bacterium]